jgi:predicted enzyme related to lactoylglutathione lyase
MGERSQYTPGTFCWCELSTTDQDAAKAFYGALFGWVAEDLRVGDDGVYSMMQLDGQQVAAIAKQPQAQTQAGVPSLWHSYVSVASADQTAQRAKELGADVHAGPFDVMEAGRMAVIRDPQGAYFFLWEPRMRQGATLVNAPGALVWNELQSPDLDASAAFYDDLFGWQTEQVPAMPTRYLSIKNGEAANGGMRELDEGMPPNWLAYFGTADVERGLARVLELGGKALTPVIDIQMAKFAVVQDPQGAVFALYAGELEP